LRILQVEGATMSKQEREELKERRDDPKSDIEEIDADLIGIREARERLAEVIARRAELGRVRDLLRPVVPA
jgi:hypothetical protein